MKLPIPRWLKNSTHQDKVKAEVFPFKEGGHFAIVDGEIVITDLYKFVGDEKSSYQTADHGAVGDKFLWLLQDGRAFDMAKYPALAVLFPGGILPDHQGRASVGAGQGAGLSNKTLGSTFGSETKTINVKNLPSFNIPIGGGAYTDDYNNYASGRATTNFTRWTTNLTFTGQNLPLNVEQPSIVKNYFIYTGI
jgi:hypothetical protein